MAALQPPLHNRRSNEKNKMTAVANGVGSMRDGLRERAAGLPDAETAGTESEAVRQHWSHARRSRETYLAVVHFMDNTIQFGRPTVHAAATAASMNLRTLQRHLATCGVTFATLLNEYRHRHAVRYLQNSDLSVTDIAFKLGYSDSAHFTRAFRRWTGSNPREFQRTPPQERDPAQSCRDQAGRNITGSLSSNGKPGSVRQSLMSAVK
jgi:AraC-like DNA-binding protein